MFDSLGNPTAHLACVRALVQVSEKFMTSCHTEAVRRAKTPTQVVTKIEFLRLKLTEEDVIRDEGSVGSHKHYLKGLGDEDTLTVKALTMHGLRGRDSNNKKKAEREAFREFVKLNRSPTGRTKDSEGRYHGAEYYLVSKITKVKTQPGRHLQGEENPDEVLELVVKAALKVRAHCRACPLCVLPAHNPVEVSQVLQPS